MKLIDLDDKVVGSIKVLKFIGSSSSSSTSSPINFIHRDKRHRHRQHYHYQLNPSLYLSLSLPFRKIKIKDQSQTLILKHNTKTRYLVPSLSLSFSYLYFVLHPSSSRETLRTLCLLVGEGGCNNNCAIVTGFMAASSYSSSGVKYTSSPCPNRSHRTLK